MKKFFSIFIVGAIALVINSCGNSSKIANDPYLGEGHGESINIDIAREKAYSKAVADIARKFNRSVRENAEQDYASEDRSKGKTQESLSFRSHLAEHSTAQLGDVVIKKERRWKVGKKWHSEIIVAISPDNIE